MSRVGKKLIPMPKGVKIKVGDQLTVEGPKGKQTVPVPKGITFSEKDGVLTVLRDGEVVVTDSTSNFDRSRLVHAMVGRNLSNELYGSAQERKTRPYGEEILSARNLSMGNIVRNTSFSVFSGQITGMFGLVGAGRRRR